jgi:hypothetical protein
MVSDKRCPVKRVLKMLFYPWPSVQNVLLVLAALYLIIRIDLTASEWASWVQAVGSIAAILGAFALSNNQFKRQSALQLESEKRKFDACFAVVKNAAEHARVLREMVLTQNDPASFKSAWVHQYSEIIQASVRSLRLLPAHELGSYDLVIAHNGIVADMEGVLQKVNKFVAVEAFTEEEGVMLFVGLTALLLNIDFYWSKFQEATVR